MFSSLPERVEGVSGVLLLLLIYVNTAVTDSDERLAHFRQIKKKCIEEQVFSLQFFRWITSAGWKSHQPKPSNGK